MKLSVEILFRKLETIHNTKEKIMKNMPAHRTVHRSLLASLLVGLSVFGAYGQFTFSSGSDMSYGAINITSNTTLAVTTNGIFNCTTITVVSNYTLTFSNNLLNTPVYLLATGDVIINGTINVRGATGSVTFGGAGGPGGFAGGNPGMLGLPSGDGYGPGAGRRGTTSNSNSTNDAGHASYGTASFQITAGNGLPYGSPLLIPLVGGSGGGGRTSLGGNGGGGAILIASSSSITIRGAVVAKAVTITSRLEGAGSGGAIRILAPVISGNGALDVSGESDYSAAGRIRVDCMDRRFLALSSSPNSVASIGANMITFLPTPPRLDITQAAGNNIPVGTNTPVFFLLPQGSSTNQTVTVRASNFGANVPIRVVLTPDNGPGSSYDTNIDNTINPASVTVNVVVPVNVLVRVNAWTR